MAGSGSVSKDETRSARARCLKLNGSRSRALTGSADSTLRMWRVRSGMAVGYSFMFHTAQVNCVAWSMDETRAVSGASDVLRACGCQESAACVTAIVWSRRRSHVCRVEPQREVCRVWVILRTVVPVGRGERCLIGRPIVGHHSSVCYVAWRWDGKQVAFGSAQRAVRVLDARVGTEVGQLLVDHTGNVSCISWSLVGSHIAIGLCDGTVRVGMG